MNRSIRIAIVCLVAVPMLGGCAGLMKGLAAKMDPSVADKKLVNDAAAANKWDDVKKYCDRKFKKPDGKKLHYKAKRLACDTQAAHLKAESDKAWKGATCKDIVDVWKKYKPAFSRQRGKLNGYHAEACVRMGKCGHYGYVFKELIHWGPMTQGAVGIKSLKAMDKAGLPVEKEYLKWFSKQASSPYSAKLGMYAIGHYGFWRRDKGGTINCKPYINAWKSVDEGEALVQVYSFLRRTKCVAAADMIFKGLTHSNARTRLRACQALGVLGNKKHIKKMSILAKSDGTYKIVRRNKIYWVRDMCRQAVGQIKMR
ncbi:MAG: hypothetical protein KC502_13530 [Myxococcales bacterium]|nr:hypothetical protein [Myxococcales bacterium]